MSRHSGQGEMRVRNRWRLLASVLLLLGFALRIHRLDAQALSGDEAFTIINWTRQPLDVVFRTITLIDPQPPVTLVTVIGWVQAVGDSVFAVRMLPALASTTALAAIYAVGRRLGSRRTATLALGLAAINPFQIWYAQDNRSYALWIAISAVSAWLFLIATSRPHRRRWWLAYVIAAALGLYTYYLEGFLLVAQNLYVATRVPRERSLLRPWIASQLTIAALIAPWYLRPAFRNSGYVPTAGPVDFPWPFSALLFGETLPRSLNQPLFTLSTHEFTPTALIGLLLTGAATILLARSRWSRAAVFLPLYAIVPIVLLALLTTITGAGLFRPRYVAASSMAFILLVAFLIDILWTRWQATQTAARAARQAAGSLTLLVVFGLGTASLWTYHFRPSKAPLWPEIVDTLNASVSPGDIIVQNFPDPAFDYYYTGGAATTLLPPQADTPTEETHRLLAELMAEYDNLWLIPVPSEVYDQDQVVVRWLLENTQLLSEQWIGATHIMQFTAWEIDESELEQPISIDYGGIATLRGYDVTPPAARWARGGTIYVQTIWEPRHQTDTDLTLFVHLLGPPRPDGSPLWSQDDHPPQRGRATTSSWQPGTLLRDVAQITIPADAVPGAYTLTVGLYDPASGERAPLAHAVPQAEPGGATLATFTLP